jgi:outer membrane protein OmpA-like peptidoglycan-associated protein/ABC-type nitrate/sulfonate/bicarbonate transport system substrate-binding protein
MFSKLKPLPRAIVLGALVAGVLGAAYWALNNTPAAKYFQPAAAVPTAVPEVALNVPSVSTPTGSSALGATAAPAGTQLRVVTIPWNGNSGALYAQSAGLNKARGIDVVYTRKDMYDEMIAELAAFAKDPNQGAHFAIIMGDALPGFVLGANKALKPFGTSAAGVAGIGYSRGEDKCIIADGANPRGSLIAGVPGDGDINICLKYAADNKIAVNTDPKVYNPQAMNFTFTGSFTDADQKFIASAKAGFAGGACEDRRNTETGRMQSVCVNGTATWTPGDVAVFNEMKKLGKSIVVLASTKEYMWQMPTMVVGNREWMAKNQEVVKAFLAAALEGGEKVRGDSRALMVAAEMQTKVNKEQDPSYWAQAFRGFTETGPNGKPVALGGSTTNGLADAAFLFGLGGADDLYKSVYSVYGKLAVQFFPDMVPNLVPYEQAVDKRYVAALLDGATNIAQAATPTFTGASTETVAAKSVSIEFESGKATFTPRAVAVLNDVLDQAAVTSLSVQINGHTDNVGDPSANLALSKARAEAVKQFLMTNAPKNFPSERVTTRGFGDTQPVADNNTVAGKAQNRRVEILLRR